VVAVPISRPGCPTRICYTGQGDGISSPPTPRRPRESLKLRIHRLAVAEIDHEVDYYESCSVGLGAELEDEIDAVLETILWFPRAAPQWRDRPDRRVAVLDR
jgi:hypothetical protein